MDLGINGKTALLLSSTRGLGFGCAKALVDEGVRVVINGRNGDHGEHAVSELGERAHFIQGDLAQSDLRDQLYHKAHDHLGTIDILVINIDSPSPGSFMSKGIADWKAAFEQTMVYALDMIHKCLPGMMERGFGRIVNNSSTSAKEISAGTPFSSSLKPGLLGALGSLAREVADTGVTVNSILPGPFDTDMMRRYAQSVVGRNGLSPEEAVKIQSEKYPMKRWGTIEEYGALCAFLCSTQAGYITGQSIVIDGGLVPSLL